MEEMQHTVPHRLVLEDRKSGLVTGVRDVQSFDEKEILLKTERGLLTVKGDKLHVKRLTLEKGEVELEGMVDLLQYSDLRRSDREGESILSRLFR